MGISAFSLPPTAVTTHLNEDGRVEVSISSARGTLKLEVSIDGSTVSVPDVERTQRLGRTFKYKFVYALEANGDLRGWFVEKQGDPPAHDTIAWFSARQLHTPHRSPQPSFSMSFSHRRKRRECLPGVNEQVSREANALLGIETERGKRRQAENAKETTAKRTNKEKSTKVALVPPSEKGTTRKKVAEKLGVGQKTAEQSAFCVRMMDALEKIGKTGEAHQVRQLLRKNVSKAYRLAKDLDALTKPPKENLNAPRARARRGSARPYAPSLSSMGEAYLDAEIERITAETEREAAERARQQAKDRKTTILPKRLSFWKRYGS